MFRFWPYLAAVAFIGGGLWWVHHRGYEAGYAEREAYWKPLFDAADSARAAAEARTASLEAQSTLISARLEAEYDAVVSSLTLRAAAADQRLRAVSVRLAARPAACSSQVPSVSGSQSRDADAAERERRASEAGGSIADVGRDCGDDAARVEFWNDWYAEQQALSLTSTRSPAP